MELKTFSQFEQMLREMEARRDTLAGEIAGLEAQATAGAAGFDVAILEGADPEKLQGQADALEKKIALKRREMTVVEAALSGKARTGPIYQAARACWNEGADLITETIRAEWDAKLAELGQAQAAYLALCGELGAIQRRADAITSKLSYGLENFLSGTGVPRLATNIYPDRQLGPIFLDHHEIKVAFQKGA